MMNTKYPISRVTTVCVSLFAILLIFSTYAFAQSPESSAAEAKPSPTPRLEKKFFANILRDQRDLWLAPFHLNRTDTKWIVPLGISAAALFASDRHTSGELFENGDNQTQLRISRNVSRIGSLYATGGVAGVFYVVGRATNNDRARETGLLGTEALIDSGIIVEALKAVSQRQRPPTDHTSGEFFDGGSSFPSGHAISAWSLATVVSEEYGQHRPLVRFGVFGLATAVSLARYTGRNHFLSDVLVGSAMGYGIGRYVYHQHHDTSLDFSKEKLTSGLVRSKFYPHIAPLYNPQRRIYGANLAWDF